MVLLKKQTQGRIDTSAVTDFLRECIARRYYAGSSGLPPSALRGRGPSLPRPASNPGTPPFSGFHDTLPPGARTPPPVWGTPSGPPPPLPFSGMRGLGSRTTSYQSVASSSDYGWGSGSEAGGVPASGVATGAFIGGHSTIDMNGRIDD